MCNTDAKGFKLDKFLGNLQVCGIVEIPLHHSLIIINLKLNLLLIEFYQPVFNQPVFGRGSDYCQ